MCLFHAGPLQKEFVSGVARNKNGVPKSFVVRKARNIGSDNYYGVPKDEITVALGKGVDVIVKVDVQGAATIKEILPQAVFIFLMPPSLEELEKRLRRRHSESTTGLALRLEKAKEEIKSLPLFDYVITCRQNKLDEVVSQIDAIVAAEKCRVKPRIVQL